MNLWEAWTLSKQWQVMPHELYFINDEVACYCFNRAVSLFGNAVDNDINAAIDKAKNSKAARAAAHRTLLKWLNQDGNVRGMYKDPAKVVMGDG